MLRIVMLLALLAAKRCAPIIVPKAHFTSEGNITHEVHITFLLRNTSLKKALAIASAFFWLTLLVLQRVIAECDYSATICIPLAVLGVKPWEYETNHENAERATQTLRTTALSQSVLLSGTLTVKLLSVVRVLSILLVPE